MANVQLPVSGTLSHVILAHLYRPHLLFMIKINEQVDMFPAGTSF